MGVAVDAELVVEKPWTSWKSNTSCLTRLSTLPRMLLWTCDENDLTTTIGPIALDDRLAQAAQNDHQSGAGLQARARIGRTVALDLDAEDDPESNDGTENIQCVKRYASLKGKRP